MADIGVMTVPALSRLPRVELMHAGTWNLSTGPATFTPADFAAAVAALDCPAVRRPILKLGHTDGRFNDPETGQPYDGQPAVGWVDNLATAMNGQELVGDYVGMPGWLGPILASAYPDRSVEGRWNFVCQVGHLHPFVLTAVALLGVAPPGIGTLESLQDVASLYGVAAAEPLAASGIEFALTFHAAAGQPATGAMVALVPSDADAERLAVVDGEPADELHVTLRYLGKATDIDADDQQRIIDAVTAIAGSTAPIDGDGFSVALFNPTNADRETCIALGINGAGLDTVHTEVENAVDALGIDMPDAHLPWTAHLTLEYTDDATQVAALIDRTGPIVFDRLRIAFAGVATDIPLGGTPVAATRKDSTMPNPTPREVAAGVSVDDVRSEYYEDAPVSFWICEIELEPLQLIVADESTDNVYRVPVTISGEDITFGAPIPVMVQYIDKTETVAATAAAGKLVFASRAESRPATPIAAAAIPVHHTDTDDGAWNAATNVKNLSNGDGADEYKKAFAWVNPDGDPDTKAAYKFPHHDVNSDGDVGAANIKACQSAIGVLNGGMGGADIPDADVKAVYKHLAAHITDAHLFPAALKTQASAGHGHTHDHDHPAPVASTEAPAAEPVTTPPTEEDSLSTITSDVRSRLGLAEDAPDDDLLAALDATITKANTPQPEPVAAGAPQLPKGIVAIDETVLTELKASAADGRAARLQQRIEARDRLLDAAIAEGKIPPARRDHWIAQFEADTDGATAVLASLAPGLIPIVATGYADTEGPDNEDHAFDGMFPPSTDDTKGA